MLTQYKTVFIMIFVTLWVPLVFNYFGYVFIEGQWVQFALHSLMEVLGAVLALVMAIWIVKAVDYGKLPDIFKWVALAFGAMGVLDLFHAAMNVDVLFVWFHSMSGFFASFILMVGVLKQCAALKMSSPRMSTVIGFIAAFSVVSFVFETFIPPMTNHLSEFTVLAKVINVSAGVMFVISGLYFTHQYFKLQTYEYLMVAGFCFLMVASELSFAISNLWDFSWWGWHLLRLLAFVSLAWFFFELFKNMIENQMTDHAKTQDQLQDLRQECCQVSQYAKLLDQTSLVSKSDLQGHITDVNEHLLESTGYRREELIGQSHAIFKSEQTPNATYDDLWRTIQAGQLWIGQLQNRKKNGELYNVNLAVLPIQNPAGEVVEYLAARQDITQAVRSQELLANVRNLDDLTGFKNRNQLIQDLDSQQIEKIALLNIDDFKEINDFFGLNMGNELIRKVGLQLAKMKDPALRIYRMHGDEFALAVMMSDPVDGFEAKIWQWATELSEVPFEVQGKTLYLTVKAGIAEGMDSALTAADMALKVAKKTKRIVVSQNETYLFSHQYKENEIWTHSLKKAFKENGILLVYQPIYDLQKQKTVAHECLVRLCKEGELIEPQYFLEVAKKTRLYPQLTERILSLAFETFQSRTDGFSVNVCLDDMVNEKTITHIKQLCQTGSCADRLSLEFTEAEAEKNLATAGEFVQTIKSLGIRVTIDDVGKDASHLETIIELQPDYIKLDGRLVHKALEEASATLIIKTLVNFAHHQKIKVIAEAVETQALFLKLKTLKVDFVQGYFTGKPKRTLSDASENEVK